MLFVAYSIYSYINATGTKVTSYAPFLLLFVALLIALGFELVDGFHDTAMPFLENVRACVLGHAELLEPVCERLMATIGDPIEKHQIHLGCASNDITLL